MSSDRPTVDEAVKLRDHIRHYGQWASEDDYMILKDFGQWFTEQADAGDVILSDWTPVGKSPPARELLMRLDRGEE